MPKKKRLLPRVLTEEEVERLIAVICLDCWLGLRTRAMLEVTYGGGLRSAELLALDVGDLQPDLGVMRVLGKGGAERLAPMSGEAVWAVEQWLPERAGLAIDGEQALWVNRYGVRLSRRMWRKTMKQLAYHAEIAGRKVHPHVLRHSFATHLLDGGATVPVVQALLGHESIANTQGYLHVAPARLRGTYDRYHPRSGVEPHEEREQRQPVEDIKPSWPVRRETQKQRRIREGKV